MSDSQNSSVLPVIEMTDVAVRSAQKTAETSVNNVNWRVAAGDFWVVFGLEGSGKSDLLMLLAGLMPPASGTYRLFNEVMPILEGDRLITRLRLGVVFDDGRLFNHLTVAENIALPLQYHHELTGEEARERVLQILEFTELSAWANHTPGAMAWSWQKRAALARAIALKPEVLLLDEPLVGLDALHTAWWLNFSNQLSAGCDFMHDRPVTLIATTGALNPWKDKARQFALMKQGEFNVIGSREQLGAFTGSLAGEFLSKTADI